MPRCPVVYLAADAASGHACETHLRAWPCALCERSDRRETIFLGVLVIVVAPMAGLAYLLIGLP
jgi:hypothetical protein